MKRLRPTKTPRRVTRREVTKMVSHFERRAEASEIALQLATDEKKAKSEGKRSRWEDVDSVKAALLLSQALYDGGKLTREEYFFHSIVPVEHLHEHKHLAGGYEDKLSPISLKIRSIEVKHGLKDGEYWPRGVGPANYHREQARYEKVLDKEFGVLLRLVGLDEYARLWRTDRPEFDRLREAGRAAIFEADDLEYATAKLIEVYEEEAIKCAAAKAYYAACVMLGSAAEATILLRCIQRPTQLAAARSMIPASRGFHKGGPSHWNLSQLIEVANQAGWAANLQTKNVLIHIVALISHLHEIRNLVHPGRHASRKPHVSIGHEQFADAHTAYLALRYAFEHTK